MKTVNSLSEVLAGSWVAPAVRERCFAMPHRRRIPHLLFCTGFIFLVAMSLQSVRADSSVDGVTLKDGKEYCIQAGSLELLTNNLTLPFDVEVNTNGTFKIGEKGNDRELKEGQVIRSDGWLTNPDGSVEPVFDHIAVKGGKVIVVRAGQGRTLSQPMICTNGLNLSPDGSCVYPGGRQARLLDGQLFRLDGTVIPAEDAATLVNGQVVVQREGALIHLAAVQMMGMPDGTKVYGNGNIQKSDGSITQLKEGQTVLMEGIRVGQ